MGDFARFLIKAFLRKGLTILGTYLLAVGVISESEADSFVGAHLDELLGALILGGSALWTVLYNRYVRDKVTAALALPGGSSPETLKTVMEEKKEGI